VVETGTFPATSTVASLLGAQPLDAETSTNYTLGAVFRFGDFDLTIDAYQIDIEDQIVLSELINRSFSPQVAALLDPLGIQAARFFLNGVETSTKGVDVVGRYRLYTETYGDWDFTVAANFNDVEVTGTPTSSSVLSPVPPLFARSRILSIEEGTPDTKVSGTTDWSYGQWGLTARATYYASVLQPGSTAAADYSTGDKLVADFEGRFKPNDRITLALGVDNAFDEYPDAVPAALNSNGVLGFPFYSPFGFNGRFVYARIGLNW
ncbi:MAG: TonB-dependent receptor, partial [Brevundimonas sp.]